MLKSQLREVRGKEEEVMSMYKFIKREYDQIIRDIEIEERSN